MNKIKEVRNRLGITQKELADRLGITQVAVSKYELPDTNIRLDTLERIAAALDVNIADLTDSGSSCDVLHLDKLNDRGKEQVQNFVDILSKVPDFKK